MARKIKGKQYDLNHPFSARDVNKSRYSRKAAESLVLWLQMTPGSPTNGANNSLEAEYEGTPAISFEPIYSGLQRRHVAAFSDSGNSNIKVASNIALSHSTLAHGGTPQVNSDLPFSVSMWVNFDDIETGEPHYVFGKDDGSGWEYFLYHSLVQRFVVSLSDTANSKSQYAQSTSPVTPSDFNEKWNHIVVTYDGRGGDSAYLGIKMYINGAEHALSDAGSESGYVGMRPNTGTGTGELYVGSAYEGSAEFDGSMSEFAMWKGHALSQAEVAAIYNITRYGKKEVSGIVNNPPRTLLRSADRLEGAYPAALRGCGSDFMGRSLLPFDDLNSPVFSSNFSQAEIEFVPHENSHDGGVVFEDLTFIGLTGSVDESQGAREGRFHNFTFVNGASTPDIKVVTYDNDVRVHLSGSSDASFIAKAFTEQVNKQSMGITATSVGPKVRLIMQIPGTGSYVHHHNTIVTGNLNNFQMDPGDPIKVSQFSQVSGDNIDYPSGLPSSFFSKSFLVASPFTSASIKAPGIAKSGLDNVKYIPRFSGESLKPFDDSRVHLDRTSPFYSVGTPSSVISGFDSPLRSKSFVTFDLVSDVSDDGGLGTHIFFATASINDGTDVKHRQTIGKSGSGMAYWNSSLSRWEMLESESLDVHASDPFERVKACLGFSPSAGHVFMSPGRSPSNANSTGFVDIAGAVGNPISEFGFPLASQYNATGSQCYNMSDYITAPFLVEKIALDIEGEFGINTQFQGNGDQPYFKQFFILNQTTGPNNPHLSGTLYIDHTFQTSHSDATAGGSTTRVDRGTLGHRELIGYAKIGFLRDDHETVPVLGSNALRLSGLKKDIADVLKLAPQAAFNTVHGVSGSFRVEFEPSVASFSNGTSLLSIRRDSDPHTFAADDYILLTNKGGATCTGDLSGRQIGSSFSNFPVVKILDKNDAGDSTLQREIRHNVRQHSPYLLMPEDKLVFGWQNHGMAAAPENEALNIGHGTNIRTERRIATEMVDRIKRAKVTLYGSHVANEAEKHHGTNQLLTTNEIYEVIGNDPVLDQFDVGELVMLSGSMSDAIMTGQAFLGTRRRVCSIASGQSGTTGSLNRNIKQFRNDAFFKDSIHINPFSFVGRFNTPPSGVMIGGEEMLPLIPPWVSEALAETVDIDGVGISVAEGVANYLKMFPNAMDGQFLLLSDVFNTPIDIIEGGGVTDPPPEGQTAGQFVNFPKAHAGDASAGGDPNYVMDALSADPTNFGSTDEAPRYGDSSITMGMFADTVFQGHSSPGSAPYGPIDTTNPILVEVTPDGQNKKLKGTAFNKPGRLPDYDFDNSGGLKFFSDAIFESLINIAFPPAPYVCLPSGGSQLSDSAGFFVPAGFKYGYSHGLPTPPSYHFSRRHYGQYADMVESPGETCLMQDGSPKTMPAVRVKFFSRGGEPDVDPITTNSQNLSVFCTSSIPYDEGPGSKRDRSSTQPDLKDFISLDEGLELNVDS